MKWFHIDLRAVYTEYWPQNVVDASDKEYKARCNKAVKDWDKSICQDCANLDSFVVSTHAWRHCKIGSGPGETECKRFERKKKCKKK